MINGKSVLAIVPARGGSKGLPRKNVRSMCGKPLIVWTIEKALKSVILDEVMVSTDSREIAEIALAGGVSVPFIRPADLATDTATSIDVVLHTIDFYRDHFSREFDYIVLLEPTSPLREDDDIDRMLAELDQNSDHYDAIVSIGEVGEHPSIMKTWTNGGISPFCPELPAKSRRQDNEPAYFPYGVAYITKTAALLRERTFYCQRCMGFPIRRYQRYEVDDIYDFICIERVMQFEWGIA